MSSLPSKIKEQINTKCIFYWLTNFSEFGDPVSALGVYGWQAVVASDKLGEWTLWWPVFLISNFSQKIPMVMDIRWLSIPKTILEFQKIIYEELEEDDMISISPNDDVLWTAISVIVPQHDYESETYDVWYALMDIDDDRLALFITDKWYISYNLN